MDDSAWIAFGAIGTWVAGVATIAAVVTSLYLARKSSQVKVSKHVIHSRGKIIIRLFNIGHIPSEVEYVYLVKRKHRFTSSFSRVGNENFVATSYLEYMFNEREEEESFILHPSSPPLDIELSFDALCDAYTQNIPFEEGNGGHHNPFVNRHRDGFILSKPTRMTDCQIAIVLNNGDVIFVNLPEDFYSYYRTYIIRRDLMAFNVFFESSEYNVTFSTKEELIEAQQFSLNRYLNSYKSFLLLYR